MTSKVIKKEDCRPEGFRWITLKRITYTDPTGKERLWESAERTTRRGAVDGVAIVAKIIRAGHPPMLPVLKQFRPPVDNYCLELPAGLVDAGESAAQAAVRELLEETGYRGAVVEETTVCVSDPGMSNANMQYVTVEVDGDAPENQNVVQKLEDGEHIQVELVPWAGLLQHLQQEMRMTGCEVDARLLSYALGLEHALQAAGNAASAAQQQAQQAQAQLGKRGSAPGLTAQQSGLAESSSSGWGLLPFGSPILSAQASSAQAQDLNLGGSLLQPAAGGAPAGGVKRPQLGRWAAFAAGAAAGAAACWLSLGKPSRGPA